MSSNGDQNEPNSMRSDEPASMEEEVKGSSRGARMLSSSPARSLRSNSSRPASRARSVASEEPEGEDLFDDNVERDYRAIPELDKYDEKMLDSGDYDQIDLDERRKADREMNKRDRERARREGRVPRAFEDDEEEEQRPRRRRRIQQEGDEMLEDAEDDAAAYVNLDEYHGTLSEWLTNEKVRDEVKRRFRLFLTSFSENEGDRALYPGHISNMCSANKASLVVSYTHLSTSVPTLAIWVADAPTQMLELFDEVAQEVTLTLFRNYDRIVSQIHVRIKDLPIVDSLRDLRAMHLAALVKVRGVVTRRTPVFPQLKMVKFNCAKCGFLLGPFFQTDSKEVDPGSCPECQSSGPFRLNVAQTLYRNYQRITMQESPGSVPAGRIPRQKDVILLHDLIDICRPGEEVEVTGVFESNYDASLNSQQGFPVFHTVIKANHIKRNKGNQQEELSDDDIKKIHQLGKNPNISQMIFNSIAPSICGHENIKKSIAMSLFGGVEKRFKDKHRIRGDINVLVMGDPGCGKSQFLKYAEKTSHRAVYTTGKGASAVGLTAAVARDPLTREWTLEGGALVLADQGVCLIDEFDKMNDQDRTSIHEAMEQQSISISKAGIVTSLQARCAVMAAANPIKGRYDSTISFIENVDLPDSILSRFDCLCVVRDIVDAVNDERVANFVVESHIKSHPKKDSKQEESKVEKPELPSIDQELLRKYILYARNTCKPKLSQIDEDRIAKLYSELRRESMNSGGIPIAVRHIESLIRMSEAHAKMHLRDYVNSDDVNLAISVMLDSFISTQKFSVKRALEKHFRSYLNFRKDSFQLLLFTLDELVREQANYQRLTEKTDSEMDPYDEPVQISVEDFEAKARELDIPDVSDFYKSSVFKKRNFILDASSGQIIYDNRR
mmetsp:Transcript_9857/g.24280  ORF Transcript_9857/g.24280 Transcript_9857/m.24280 type:complete len:895 (+) Transcript_9857:158-2842(+)